MADKKIKVEINNDGTISNPLCPFCGGDVQYASEEQSYMYISWISESENCEIADVDKTYPSDRFHFECKDCDRKWGTAKDYFNSVKTGAEPKKMATAPKMVIVIEGGMVTDILCTRNIDVLEVDRDTEGSASPATTTWKANVCGDEKEMQNFLEGLNSEFDSKLNENQDEDEYWKIEENQSTLVTFLQHLKDGTTLG